jgi:beta-1,4-N-acetylglucosaminyltransferase
MIFVTVGTGEQQFDRLLRCVESLSVEEPVVIQYGSSRVQPDGASCVDFMPFSDLLTHMGKARVVITHAGVGSMMAALTARKRPIVVPRRRRFGEAVDDHQLELARRLAASELVTLVEDPRSLQRALAALPQKVAPPPMTETPLSQDLRIYLASCCAAAQSDQPRV